MSDTWRGEVDWADIEARFKPPAELQQRVPRRVLPRNSTDLGCRARLERGCLGGCLLPIFLLGLLLVFWCGLAALLLPLGTTATGIVTERERGSIRDSTNFLRFRFWANNRSYSGQGQVPTEKWRRAHAGDPIQVRYFPFAPGLRPLLADDFSPWASILGMGTLGLLMTGITLLPLVAMMPQWKNKKLVRHGVVTPAFIIERDDQKNQITFLIRDSNGRSLELQEHSRDLINYSAGQIETALYLPNKPTAARLYRNLDWKARLAT